MGFGGRDFGAGWDMGTLNDRDAGVGLGLYMPVRNAPVLLSASSTTTAG